MTIRNKIFLFSILLVLIPVLFITLAVYQKSYRTIINNFSSSVMRNLVIAEVNIHQKMESVYDIMSKLSLNPQMVEIISRDMQRSNLFPVSQEQIVEEMSTLDKLLEGDSYVGMSSNNIIPRLYLYNRPEYSLISFSEKVFDLQEIRYEKWYSQLRKRNRFIVCGLIRTESSVGEFNSILLAKRMYGLNNPNFQFAGIMTVEVPMEQFYHVFDNFSPSENSQVILVDDNETILLSKDYKVIGTKISDKPYYSELQSVVTNKVFDFTSITSENNLIYIKKIPEYNWTIISISPIKDLNGQLIEFNTMLFPVALICLVIAILVAFTISNNISYPIRKLINTMSTVGEGNLQAEINYNRNDEFGILITNFKNMMEKMNDLIEKLYKSELQKKEAELNALQAQINPHFLYNTLDSVNWLALKHKVPDISNMVKALSNFFRYSLSKGKNIISLREEKMQIESYLKIQKLRFNDKIDYILDLPVDLQDYLTVKLILQPLVENAIIHGIEKMNSIGLIEIIIRRKEDTIVISVSDNGAGANIDELNSYVNETKNQTKSYGVVNVNKRIQMYFGNEYGLIYEKREPVGITAKITIPLTKVMEDYHVYNGDSR